MSEAEYKIDPARADALGSHRATGIYVRAKFQGEWGPQDIATLDRASLIAWLKSRGGDNPMAEMVVFHLLGHEHDTTLG